MADHRDRRRGDPAVGVLRAPDRSGHRPLLLRQEGRDAAIGAGTFGDAIENSSGSRLWGAVLAAIYGRRIAAKAAPTGTPSVSHARTINLGDRRVTGARQLDAIGRKPEHAVLARNRAVNVARHARMRMLAQFVIHY